MNKLQTIRRWFLVSLFLALALFAISTVQPTFAQDRAANGTVNTGLLNVRTGPSIDTAIVTTVNQGNVVAVLGRSGANTWVQVRTYNGQIGWVNSTYLIMDVPLNNLPVVGGGSVTPPPASGPAVGVVNTGAANVRSGPGYNYPIITIAYQGYTFTLLGRTADNAWAKVQMIDGTQGWVNFGALDTNVLASTLPITDAPVTPPAGMAVGTVNTGALNVRTGPTPQHPGVAVTYYGHVVELLGRNNATTWLKVRLFGGQEGWVNARYITTTYPISNLPVMWNDAVVPGAATAVVITGNLNIRTGPGADYAAITSVPYGTTVTLVGRNADGSWVKIHTSNGTEGWVNTSFLSTGVPISSLPIVDGSTVQPVPPTQPTSNAVVTTGALHIRSGPGLNFPSLTVVNRGTQINLVGRSATTGWVQVLLPSGQKGWLNPNYIYSTININTLPVTG